MPNNIFPGPNAVIATASASFIGAGVNSANIDTIFSFLNNALVSYKPGRDINGVTAFIPGGEYYINAKQAIDLTAFCIPPLPTANGKLEPPEISQVLQTAAGTARVTFSAVEGGNIYELQRATNSGFSTGVSAVYTGTHAGSPFLNSSLPNGTFYYRVRATAPLYEMSDYSTPVSITIS